MRVSVIVPVFNGAWCIENALDSLLGQTRRPDEILVCDDGSADGTADLVERRYGEAVMVLRLPHRNASATRHTGVQRSSGQWIAFLDADDTWRPEKLERQLAVLAEHPDLRVIGSDGMLATAERVVRESWLSDYFDPVESVITDLFAPLVERCFPLMSSMMVERGAYFEAGGFDPERVHSHDYDLWLRLFAAHPVALLAERLVTCASHPTARSQRVGERDRDDLELMRRVQHGELGRRPRVQRVAATRAASLEFELALRCLRGGRVPEARGHLRRAAGGGPSGRRLVAMAGAWLPTFAYGGALRAAWLQRSVARARDSNPRLALDRLERGAA